MEEPAIEIVVPPEMQTGVYANLAAVSTQTPHDVTVDFCQVVPGHDAPQAVVVARLKMAPTFLMPLMQALSTHLAKFEAQIEQAQQQGPDVPQGDDDQ